MLGFGAPSPTSRTRCSWGRGCFPMEKGCSWGSRPCPVSQLFPSPSTAPPPPPQVVANLHFSRISQVSPRCSPPLFVPQQGAMLGDGGRNHAWVLPSARTHAGEGSRWFGEGPPSSRPHPHPHCGLCGSPVTKNLLVWAARPRWQSWLPPPRCRARGVPWRTGIFSIFFFVFQGILISPPPVIAVFKPQRLDIRGPHTEVCVLPTGNRLRVAAATLLTGLLN